MRFPPEQTVLVTGSSGLIGSAVVRRLAPEFNVIGFDRPGPPQPPEVAHAVDMDLSSEESVSEGLRTAAELCGRQAVSCIHLAAYYDFSGEESDLYERVTIQGTRRLLQGLASFDLGQFIFSSTMLVHKPCEPGQKINENWPLEPKWAYPKSKVATERVILAQHGDLPVVLMRIAGVYTDNGDSIPLVQQMQRIYERRLVSRVFPGDTSHGQAFIHLDDLVDAIRLAVHRRHELPAETILEIGEPETLSYDELQRTFGRLIHGEDWKTTQIPKFVARAGAWVQDVTPGEEPFIKPWMIDLADDHYELDISRAQQMLGWAPKRRLRDTLPAMVAALKRDPAGWYRHHGLELPASLEKAGA